MATAPAGARSRSVSSARSAFSTVVGGMPIGHTASQLPQVVQA
jgi:hypothetical protein